MYDEFYHHGIKGMKWGIRRYQNSDGSLTPAGKRRADRQARKEAKAARKWAYKNRSIMSEQELDAQIRRYQKERQFADLSRQSLSPGRTAAKSTLAKYGGMAAGMAVGAGVSTIAGGYARKVGVEQLGLGDYIKKSGKK